MTKLDRTAKLIVAGAVATLLAGTLAACSKGPAPAAAQNQEKTLTACQALPDIQAAQVMGEKLIPVPMSAKNSPVHTCQYIDPNNETAILLQISSFSGKDVVAALRSDAKVAAGVSKNQIIPAKVHPATALGNGAFFVDNTTSPTDSSVQLHLISDSYKIMIQLNNPKDFGTGEQQAVGLAQKTVGNIKDGSAFKAPAKDQTS